MFSKVMLQSTSKKERDVLPSIKTRLGSTWNQHFTNSKASKRHVTKQIYIILQPCKAISVNLV